MVTKALKSTIQRIIVRAHRHELAVRIIAVRHVEDCAGEEMLVGLDPQGNRATIDVPAVDTYCQVAAFYALLHRLNIPVKLRHDARCRLGGPRRPVTSRGLRRRIKPGALGA